MILKTRKGYLVRLTENATECWPVTRNPASVDPSRGAQIIHFYHPWNSALMSLSTQKSNAETGEGSDVHCIGSLEKGSFALDTDYSFVNLKIVATWNWFCNWNYSCKVIVFLTFKSSVIAMSILRWCCHHSVVTIIIIIICCCHQFIINVIMLPQFAILWLSKWVKYVLFVNYYYYYW